MSFNRSPRPAVPPPRSEPDAQFPPTAEPGITGLLLSNFVHGDTPIAELAARLAVEKGRTFADVYDSLRMTFPKGTRPRSAAATLHLAELDQRLRDLATRLQDVPNARRDPETLIVTTSREGVGACLRHVLEAQQVSTRVIGSGLLNGLAEPNAMASDPLCGLRSVVVDAADATAHEALSYASAADRARPTSRTPIVVLGDDERAMVAAQRSASGLATTSFVSSISGVLIALGLATTSPLTIRERDVLELVSIGATNQQVASALGISLGSVKTYLERAQGKLHARDRASTVASALRKGWL